jgi:hypothetical protein
MAFNSEQPPHGSARPIPHPAPVDDPVPNAAMLKGDIDTGRTGDKNEVFDPGLSPLGTDEEAAGTPPSPAAVKHARVQETRSRSRWRWSWGPHKTSAAHDKDDSGVLFGFVGLIVAIGIVILSGIAWLA